MVFLCLAQITVLGVCLAVLFWIMVLGNKERIENDLRTRLDATTQAMAVQLKANQVPFSGASVDPGVFIINQTDGTVLIDRRNGGYPAQKLWEGYKTKIIYEMQKQKRGWIEYPDKSTWSLNEPRRIIRYISIDELNWILAVEDLQPSSMDLIKGSVNPTACLMIFMLFLVGAGALYWITIQYFDRLKRQMATTIEDNLLSLNGEEKLWGKSHPKAPSPPVAHSVVEDPIMEEMFAKPPSVPVSKGPMDGNSSQDNIFLPAKRKQKENHKEILKTPPERTVENKDLTVDVEHIHSPVLKNILQKFREK